VHCQQVLYFTAEPADRVHAMSRSLRILNALQVRVPSGGDQPPQLNDLGLPTETTIDLFHGMPSRVEKVPEGWKSIRSAATAWTTAASSTRGPMSA
jgi:hypothetical protein